MQTPKVSVIIPIAPEGNCEISLESMRLQNYDKKKIEVLVAVGRHRSIQRNHAIEKSSGDIIFFLDNDVMIRDPDYIKRHIEFYASDAKIGSVGGPSLTPETNPILQRAIAQVFCSYFAMSSVRSRYMSLGNTRDTDEKELILCNQSMRADAIKKVGGFNENFHAGNEENELINRLIQAGYRLIYEPTLTVYRNQRETLFAFIRQIAKYGRSRIEHFMQKPDAFEIHFLVPSFFCIYILSLPAMALLRLESLYQMIWMGPLLLYTLIAFLSALGALRRSRNALVALLTFFLYPVHHCSYALGNLYVLWRLFSPEKREIPDTILKFVDLKTGKWTDVQ